MYQPQRDYPVQYFRDQLTNWMADQLAAERRAEEIALYMAAKKAARLADRQVTRGSGYPGLP